MVSDGVWFAKLTLPVGSSDVGSWRHFGHWLIEHYRPIARVGSMALVAAQQV